MFDYKEQILEFIKLNFTPTYPDLANAKFTSEEFLSFLFQVFPDGCISDYDLNEILLSLDYERSIYTIENITFKKNEEGEMIEVERSYRLVPGWCMFTTKIPMITEKK